MAKSGLDYFPLDVNLDDKFALIEAQFGIKGFGVIVKLFQRIYGGQGYYIEWTEDIGLLFSQRVGLDYSLVSDIVSASIKRGIFDADLYEQYGVLSSRGIQERYLEAVGRRVRVEIKSEYLLLCNTQKYKNVYISAKNVSNSLKNVDISKQSKREESKRKETTTTTAEPSCDVVGVVRLFESIKAQPLSMYECEAIKDMVSYYGAEWCKDALEIMAKAGKVKISYAEGILRNWKANGRNAKQGVFVDEAEKKRLEWVAQVMAREDENEPNYQ